jgi:hypothetical protein
VEHGGATPLIFQASSLALRAGVDWDNLNRGQYILPEFPAAIYAAGRRGIPWLESGKPWNLAQRAILLRREFEFVTHCC